MSARERRAKQRKRANASRRLAAPAAFLSTAAIGLAGPALPAAHAGSFSATQLKNINTVAPGSFPQDPTDVNGTLYYSAYSPNDGRELWDSTAGSPANLVEDINPGTASSNPTDLTNAGGRLYFFAQNAAGDTTLWTGAHGGGVVSLSTPLSDTEYVDLANVGTNVYFFQSNGTGSDFWSSDGAAAGTSKVTLADVDNPYALITVGSQLYFLADGGPTTPTQSDRELWEANLTNGVITGATQLTNFVAPNDQVEGIANLAGTLYFQVGTPNGEQLWKLTGDTPGQVGSLPNGETVDDLTADGTGVYFTTVNSASSYELWEVNGTNSLTELTTLANFQYADVGYLTNVAGTLYFTDAASGSAQLWKTNGTVSGTVPVGGPNQATELVNDDGTLYFTANDGQGGIWTSNGTAAGTTEITDALSDTYPLVNSGSTVYFSAESATTQPHLWSITNSTVAEVDASIGEGNNAGSYPTDFTNVNGNVFFDATSGMTRSLWFSNGTPAGTLALTANNGSTIEAYDPVNVGGTLYFTAGLDSGLWSSNGSSAGTRPLALPNADATLTYLANVNGELYFVANGTTSGTQAYQQLWKTNGTAAGTTQLTSFANASAQIEEGTNAYGTFNAGSDAYFTVNTPDGFELWVSNGTPAGTVAVTNSANATEADFSAVNDLTAVGSDLFFQTIGSGARDLWVTSGSGAAKLETLTGQADDPYSPYLTNVSGSLFFVSANDLWQLNGPAGGETELAANLDPRQLVNVGGELFFAATNLSTQTESVWKSNGTTVGTQLVDTPGPADADVFGNGVEDLVNFDGVLAFTANDGTHGEELWTSNGTSAGTAMVSDIWPGAPSGLYSNSGGFGYGLYPLLTDAGTNLFFAADDGVDGVEPYVAAPTTAGSGGGTPTTTTPTTTTPTKTTPTTTTPTKTTPTPPIHPPHPILEGSSGSGHTIVLKLTCPTGEATCVVKGTLEIVETFKHGKLTAISAEARAGKRSKKVKPVKKTIKLSSASLDLASGHSGTLKLTLDGAGIKLLGKRHKLTTELLVTDGSDTVVKRKVTFTAPVVKKRKPKK